MEGQGARGTGDRTGADRPGAGQGRWPARWLPAVLLLGALFAGGAGFAAWLLDRPSSRGVEIFIATSTPVPDPVVQVAGAVVSPGVYTLPAGARVGDALAAAGGAQPSADTGGLNLAAPVSDGARIDVPVARDAGGAVAGAGAVAATSGLVDLNTAGQAELEMLPGIGPARARAIIEWRTQNGPFESVEALEQVPGIGPATVDAVRDLVTPG